MVIHVQLPVDGRGWMVSCPWMGVDGWSAARGWAWMDGQLPVDGLYVIMERLGVLLIAGGHRG